MCLLLLLLMQIRLIQIQIQIRKDKRHLLVHYFGAVQCVGAALLSVDSRCTVK